jgi:hypothetical protein
MSSSAIAAWRNGRGKNKILAVDLKRSHVGDACGLPRVNAALGGKEECLRKEILMVTIMGLAWAAIVVKHVSGSKGWRFAGNGMPTHLTLPPPRRKPR